MIYKIEKNIMVISIKSTFEIFQSSLGLAAPKALGIGAASFASGGGAGSEQRYSGKPDGRAVSGAGTPKRETQNHRISG